MKVYEVRRTIAALIARSIPDLSPSFEKFASGLKKLAEGGTR
jgi:hypothetical protein